MASTSTTSELTSLIISQLVAPTVYNQNSHVYESEPVSIYATVSKEWQTRIECHTFSRLHLTPARIAEVERIVQGSRQKYVRHIDLDVELDPYDEAACGRHESDEDQERNNQVFTQTFQNLFKALSSWPEGQVKDLGITLSVKVYSPTDISRLGQSEARARRRRIGEPKDILDRRFERSYVRFTSPEKEANESGLLDSVSAFTELHIDAGKLRHVWPASCSTIANKLPRLRSFNLSLCDNEKKDLSLRKAARSEFAKSFALWPASISKLDLSYYNSGPQDETFSPPNILEGSDNQDLLSLSLHKLSEQLTTLTLQDITIGPEFFWPGTTNATSISQVPHWPQLTSITVNYTPITPSGHWLFDRDSSEPTFDIDFGEDPSLYMSEDELPAPEDRRLNPFPHKAAPELMNALYLAAGTAAAQMPALREVWLGASMPEGLRHWFEYKGSATSACATWGSTPLFEPDEEVLAAWRVVSRKCLGVELEVEFVEAM